MRTGLLRHPLEKWIDPADVFAALFSGSDTAFWLDSGMDATTGHSHMAASSRVLEVAAGSRDVDVFGLLSADLSARRLSLGDSGTSTALGWVGWLGYELRGATLGVPAAFESRYPDAFFMFVDRCVSFDHELRTVALHAVGGQWSGELADWRDGVLATLAGLTRLAGQPGLPPGVAPNDTPVSHGPAPHAQWRYTDAEYLAMIQECQAAIVDGDAYQLCLTTEVEVDVSPDPLQTYRALRASSPTHHGALIRARDISLLSASPEQFLTVSADGVIETKPIKGTRRRGATPQEDEALRVELEASDKERAENLMIVDLSRNDITKVSTIGSVTVPSLLAVETYAHVHQLVSTVRGQLAEGMSAVDAVAACFPAGSMTGAPKLSATQILESLERRARGIYSGAFGVLGLDGSIDLAMVIRSIVIDPEGSTIGTGGGITALSVPADELEEARLKAAALLKVLGVEVSRVEQTPPAVG
jgi:para-aminobenzoate synthetase component 1